MGMARLFRVLALSAPLLATGAVAQPRGAAAPHAWLFGSWTGGLYPAADAEGAACFGQPTVIFTRDVVMRASLLDVAYRQRLVETAAATPDGVEFRFTPAPGGGGAMGGRLPPDFGFGCEGNPNLLRVVRQGENEIIFPDCTNFPSPLKRCVAR